MLDSAKRWFHYVSYIPRYKTAKIKSYLKLRVACYYIVAVAVFGVVMLESLRPRKELYLSDDYDDQNCEKYVVVMQNEPALYDDAVGGAFFAQMVTRGKDPCGFRPDTDRPTIVFVEKYSYQVATTFAGVRKVVDQQVVSFNFTMSRPSNPDMGSVVMHGDLTIGWILDAPPTVTSPYVFNIQDHTKLNVMGRNGATFLYRGFYDRIGQVHARSARHINGRLSSMMNNCRLKVEARAPFSCEREVRNSVLKAVGVALGFMSFVLPILRFVCRTVKK